MVGQSLALSLSLLGEPEADGGLSSEAARAEPAEVAIEPEEDEYSASRAAGFRYRGTSLGFGARFLTVFYCDGYGPCALSPFVGATTEVGWRRLRLVFDLYTAPAPLIDYDYLVVNVITANLGVSAGNESYRATLLAGGGFFWWGLELRGLAAPWRGKQGGRHGLEVGLGWGLFAVGTLTVGYRWFPPKVNLRSRSRRGSARARP